MFPCTADNLEQANHKAGAGIHAVAGFYREPPLVQVIHYSPLKGDATIYLFVDPGWKGG